MKKEYRMAAGKMNRIGVFVAVLLVAAIVGYFRGPLGRGAGGERGAARPGVADDAPAPMKAPEPVKIVEPVKAPEPVKGGEVVIDPASIRFGLREPRARVPGTIRVATFNIENLFDDKDDPTLTGSGEDKSMTKPAAERVAAAAAIRRIDADVLALQEVESLEALLWFRDEFLGGMGYEFVSSIDAGDPRGIEQSVLSRFPLSEAKVYKHMGLGGVQPERFGNQVNSEAGKPFEFKRSPLQVTVTVPGASVGELLAKGGTKDAVAKEYQLTLFVTHFKSGGRDFESQREAEARGTIELVQRLEREKPGVNVLVLGDMNATLNQGSLQQFVAAGMPSIWNDRNPRDDATTTHASGRCIDHIYYNANVKPEMVLDSRFVLGLPTRPAGADWRTTPAPAGYGSDHYPVVVDVWPVEGGK
jgi:hypothetical protein